MKDPYSVIKTMLVTEKGTALANTHNQYSFSVSPDANKIEVRQAVEKIFDVKVVSVNTMNRKGKRKRNRRWQYGKRADWKKAVVTLEEGFSIDLL
jgi:large subunit ribosomal protein L23